MRPRQCRCSTNLPPGWAATRKRRRSGDFFGSVRSFAPVRVGGGDPTHLYLMVISESIDELRPTLHQYARLLHQAGLRRHLRESRIATPAAIDRILRRCPATVWLSDEYATGVAYSKRQPAGTLEQAFGMMTSLYGKRFFQLEATSDGRAPTPKRKWCIAPRSPSSPRRPMRMSRATGAVVRNLPRRLWADAHGSVGAKYFRPSRDPAPLWLVTHLRSLRGLPADFSEFSPPSTVFCRAPGVEPEMVRATFQTSPDIHWPSFRSLDPGQTVAGHAAVGMAEHAPHQRGAGRMGQPVGASGDDKHPGVVRRLCPPPLARANRRGAGTGNEDGKTTVEQKVLDFIRKAGPNGATKKEIHMGCHAFRLMKSATEETTCWPI